MKIKNIWNHHLDKDTIEIYTLDSVDSVIYTLDSEIYTLDSETKRKPFKL